MSRVAQFHSRSNDEPLMPMTPIDRVRASIAATVTPEMAARLLQHDKANPSFRLADLVDDDERAVFVADILDLFSPERRAERTIRLNSLRAHRQALREREQQAVATQAKTDRVIFGDPLLVKFIQTNPNYCPLCGEEVITNAVDVLLTNSIKHRAHGLCCAKDEQAFVFVNEFVYEWIGGAK